MKIIEVSMHGVSIPHAYVVEGKRGKFFCLTHGEEGRGRWQLRLPLAVRDFPVPDDQKSIKMDGEYNLVDLKRQDPQGNTQYLIIKSSHPDEKQLVLLSLNPGFRGYSSYEVFGKAKVLGEGYQAQGAAGRMGGAPCPLILVDGICQITWERFGRLYGSPSEWIAIFDGNEWIISPKEQCALEDIIFDY